MSHARRARRAGLVRQVLEHLGVTHHGNRKERRRRETIPGGKHYAGSLGWLSQRHARLSGRRAQPRRFRRAMTRLSHPWDWLR